MSFPITEKQFLEWLDKKPRLYCGDIIKWALSDISDADVFMGDTDWCFGSDLVFGGNQSREYPLWVKRAMRINDKIGHEVKRSVFKEKYCHTK